MKKSIYLTTLIIMLIPSLSTAASCSVDGNVSIIQSGTRQ